MRDDFSTPKSRFFLAQTLVSRPGGITLRALMAQVGVSERTARRYVRELPAAGTPVRTLRQDGGRHSVYGVVQSLRNATIPMTELEMVGIAVARELGSYLRGTPMAQGLDQVFEKVEAALKRKDLGAHLRRKIFDVNEGAMIFRPRDRENLSAFVDALLRGHQVRICHERVGAGKTPFLVDPYSLLLHRKGPYLMGKSHHPPHKGAVRRFAFDGIRSLTWEKGKAFRYPASYSPSRELRGAFGIVRGSPTLIRIRFDASVERSVKRRRWHRSQQIGKVEGGTFDFEMRCTPSFEVKTWILGWGATATVLEPAELREDVRQEIEAMRLRY
jgi:predicted DNA-binding transcriptional regulator YafY